MFAFLNKGANLIRMKETLKHPLDIHLWWGCFHGNNRVFFCPPGLLLSQLNVTSRAAPNVFAKRRYKMKEYNSFDPGL